MLIGTATSQYQITPIRNTLGIYYHSETRMVVSNDKWTILVHKNISTIENAFNNNNNILQAIKIMLNRNSPNMLQFHSEVRTHITLLTQISNSIKNKLAEIVTDTRRYKRGLIDGVGSIFKSITGNLDAADGKYFTDSINRIKHDQYQVENLLKNQIIVTSSVVKTFNETARKLQLNENTLYGNMHEIEKTIHSVGNKVALIEAKMNLLEICEQLLESYLYLQDGLNDILNSITFARLKIIH